MTGLVMDPEYPESFSLAVVSIVFLCISWPCMLIRLYVRGFIVRALRLDDYTALIGQICFTGLCAVTIAQNQERPHQTPGNLEALKVIFSLSIVTGVLFHFSQLFIKLSLGLSFLRVLSLKLQRLTAWTLITISILINLMGAFYVLFSCGNPAHEATRLATGLCHINTLGFRVVLYIHAALGILVDLGLLALPLSMVTTSRMNAKAKTSVIMIFLLASSGTICSIVRLYFLTSFFNNNVANGTVGTTLSVADSGVFIVSGCLATMRVLVSQSGSSKSRSGTSNSQSGTQKTVGTAPVPLQSVVSKPVE